jgi:hypothetical protein
MIAAQVSKDAFAVALRELGHDPKAYEGKRLSLEAVSELYEIHESLLIRAIDQKKVMAHYDYGTDTIWIDALEAAHFYYCLRNETAMINRMQGT